jgi:hypothetical protein
MLFISIHPKASVWDNGSARIGNREKVSAG